MVVGVFLFWGAIVLGIALLIRAAARGWSAPTEPLVTGERLLTSESRVNILERRFADGAISRGDYRARREALVDGTAGPNGHKDEPLTAARAGEESQR